MYREHLDERRARALVSDAETARASRAWLDRRLANPFVKKVISGGQTGADSAGLAAAHRLGIPTGGKAPKGWRTEAGPSAMLGTVYGLTESESADYATRTRENVAAAAGTLLYGDPCSPGSLATLACCRQLGHPLLHVRRGDTPFVDVARWLRAFDVRVLNIAGNRESVSPGIGAEAFEFFLVALSVHE